MRQSRVIANLNGYLAWHNLPIRMENKGICHGLSLLCAQHILAGKIEEFKTMLQYIAGDLKPYFEQQDAINYFAVQVILAQSPEKFDKKLDQHTAIQGLYIEGKPLTSAFDFAITTNDANWANIIKTLDLKDNEPMIVYSPNHTVTVNKIDGQFIVYDPSNDDFKFFSDEMALIHDLHTNVFCYDRGPLGLSVSILKHPSLIEPRTPVFPSVIDLYERYLTQDNVNDQCFTMDGDANSTLYSAAISGNEAAIYKLIELGANNFATAAVHAIQANNSGTLKALMPNIFQAKTRQGLFAIALKNGRKEVVETLAQHDSSLYQSMLHFSRIHYTMICAIEGGNPELLEKIINDFKQIVFEQDEANGFIDATVNQQVVSNIFQNKELKLIEMAIHQGNAICVQILMDLANQSTRQLSSEEKMNFFLTAIRKNQYEVVAYLIKQIPLDILQNLAMSTMAVERTELSILRQLKQHGVIFLPITQAVMDKKEKQILDMKLNIEIIFRKFMDYIKELFSNTAGIEYNAEHFKLFKQDPYRAHPTGNLSEVCRL